MSNTTKLSGRCLCGLVSLNAEVSRLGVDACHCRMCRTWSGAPMLAVDCGSEVEIDGEAYVTIYDSSQWAQRGFCSNCGTHLFYRLNETGHYALPAGFFDDHHRWVFQKQIFTDKKPDYYEFSNETRDMTGAEVLAEFGNFSGLGSD